MPKTDDNLLHLYELPAAYDEIAEALIAANGDLTPEIEAQLAALNENLEVKVERTAALMRRVHGLALAAEEELERLKRLSQARRRTAESLKSYLLYNLQELGRNRVDTPLFSVRVQQNSVPRITWLDPGTAIPEDLRKQFVPPEPQLDTEKVRQMLRDGTALPEEVGVVYGSHLRVL